MTLDEGIKSQEGENEIYIPHLKRNGYIAYVNDDNETALVVYRLEDNGRLYEHNFFLDQLKLNK